MDKRLTRPFQITEVPHSRVARLHGGRVPKPVHEAAYEVYHAVHGEQKALIEGGCRGGFGLSELIAFLYARSFPPVQWEMRVEQALKGLTFDAAGGSPEDV